MPIQTRVTFIISIDAKPLIDAIRNVFPPVPCVCPYVTREAVIRALLNPC